MLLSNLSSLRHRLARPLRAGLAALTLLLLPLAALAQPMPELHDVTGVAADDVLNVRIDPEAGAEKLGELAHDATDVEVVRRSEDGSWGMINQGEVSGWVSMRYLKPQEGGDYILARHMACYGTEPFWSLRITQGQRAVLTTPETPELSFTAGLMQSAVARLGRYSLRGGGDNGDITVVIRAEYCADGMSEAEHALDADILIDSGGDVVHYIGCCSLISH